MISGESAFDLSMGMRLMWKLLITIEALNTMISKSGLATIHPGAFLQEALSELGLSQAEFSRQIGVSAMRISHVINGQRPVNAELALLFGRAFKQSPEYWLNLQSSYDLKTAQKVLKRRLLALHPIAAA